MTLALGLGMCLSMQVIGGGGILTTCAGILLGIIGVGLNYPIYKKLLRSGKERRKAHPADGLSAILPMCFFIFHNLSLSFYRQPQLTPIRGAAVKFRFATMGCGDLGHQPQSGSVGGPAVRLQWPGGIRLHRSLHSSAFHP